MPSLARFVVVAALAALVACADTPTAPQPRGDNVILITLDGARIEEMFGGLDVDVLRSTLSPDAVIEKHPLYLRFGAATPEERRRRLMPFFWDVLMARYGSIAGNQRLGSTVQLSNTHRFSYPGYSEMLVGEADDDRIRSNDRIHNPNTTVLEGLKARLSLSANDVAVFGSWDVLNEVVERTPGTLTVNAGYERFELPWAGVEPLNHLQFDTPTPWNSVRHDAYTFGLALAHLEAVQPRVLYLGLGETDDWAHDGRYDRTLESYARADEHLRTLWQWLEARDAYRGRTHILITTDHGRGRTPADWRNHGAKVAGAENVWMAFVTPRAAARGEWRDHAPLTLAQTAATLADWVGVDWRRERPTAAPPVPLTR